MERRLTNVPRVEHQCAVRISPKILQGALADVLDGIASQRDAWQGFALHLQLRDVGLPDVGYIAVPIRLQCAREVTDAAQFQMALSIESAMNPGAFPVFSGHCGVSALSAHQSNIWLSGAYTVPLRSFGAFFDATLLHGAANSCLRNFLSDVAAVCEARSKTG